MYIYIFKTVMLALRRANLFKLNISKTKRCPRLEINAHKLAQCKYFDNLRVTKISTSKCLQVRIMQISQTFGKHFVSSLTSMLVQKFSLAKLCKSIKKLTSSPVFSKWSKQARSVFPGPETPDNTTLTFQS